MVIEGKHIFIYGEKENTAPLVITNTFEGDGSSIYKALCSLTDKKVTLAVVSDINWNEEMSPWECPPLYKNDSDYTGGADKYLEKLTGSIIPAIKGELSFEPDKTIIAGYSLAGLFSLYSLYRTDAFSGAVSASGSLWFPKTTEFIDSNDFVKRPERIYLSLGDKEANTKNAMLRMVEDKTREVYAKYTSMGVDTIFEMNPGNHFKDADIRLAKGIAWVTND